MEKTVCYAELEIATHGLAAQFNALIILLRLRCLGPGQIKLNLWPSRLLFQPLLEALIDDSLGIR